MLERSEFERLVDVHYQSLYRVAYRLVHDHADAEEVVQEAFLKAWTRRDQFRHESTFKTWIYRIVVNTAISWQRKLRRHRKKLSSFLLEWRTHRSTGSYRVEQHFIDMELNRRLNLALERIPESSRALIVLRDIEGLAYEDIAVVLGIPIGTVKSRLWRARQQLKQELEADLRRFQIRREQERSKDDPNEDRTQNHQNHQKVQST